MASGTDPQSPSITVASSLGAGGKGKLRPGKWSSKPRAAILALSVLAIILVACGSSADSAGSSGSASSSSGTNVSTSGDGGDRAPNFAVTLFQGEDVLGAQQLNIHDLPQGKPIVLNFWAGLCPPCRAEMPDLQEFSEEFSDRVTLLGIDLGQFTGLGSLQDAEALLEELGVTYPAGFTNDEDVIKNYRVFGLPATIFIDSEGKIFKNWGGALNLDVLRDQTNAMLSQ